MRLLFLAVMLEILYYLPRFIVLVLHKLGGS